MAINNAEIIDFGEGIGTHCKKNGLLHYEEYTKMRARFLKS